MRPHTAVIDVYDPAGKVMEVHRHKGDFEAVIGSWLFCPSLITL